MNKISQSLKKVRQEFKTLVLSTSFIGSLIDNVKFRTGMTLSWASLGKVQNQTDYAAAALLCRTSAAKEIQRISEFWARMHETTPVEINYDLQAFNVKALVLSKQDTERLVASPPGTQIFIGGGFFIVRTESNAGIVGTLYKVSGYHVPVYGSALAGDTSWLVHGRNPLDSTINLPSPFSLYWKWEDTPTELTIGVTAEFRPHHYLVSATELTTWTPESPKDTVYSISMTQSGTAPQAYEAAKG